MSIYFISIIIYLSIHSQLDYLTWHALFAGTAMKIATLIFIYRSCFMHGRGVDCDNRLRKTIRITFVFASHFFFALVACFFWALQILWSV